VAGAHVLAEVLGEDQAGRVELGLRMRDIDLETEEAAHAVLRELAAAFVTPFDRADVFRLVRNLRRCSRASDNAVNLIIMFEMGALPAGLTEQVVLVGRAADLTLDAMPRLGRLRSMTQAWVEMTRLGKQSDEVHKSLVVSIISSRAEDPASMQRLLRVVDAMQQVVAAYEAVADVLEQIVVKEG
jgi:uncharacterized protein Yka (UPF0111/DUF47 family)